VTSQFGVSRHLIYTTALDSMCGDVLRCALRKIEALAGGCRKSQERETVQKDRPPPVLPGYEDPARDYVPGS
jgi:hypothetical protein